MNSFVRKCPVCSKGLLVSISVTENTSVERCNECEYQVTTMLSVDPMMEPKIYSVGTNVGPSLTVDINANKTTVEDMLSELSKTLDTHPTAYGRQRMCFVNDNDSHNYMIPVDRKEEFDKFKDMTDEDFENCYDEWVKSGLEDYRVNGISNYSFENPKPM